MPKKETMTIVLEQPRPHALPPRPANIFGPDDYGVFDTAENACTYIASRVTVLASITPCESATVLRQAVREVIVRLDVRDSDSTVRLPLASVDAVALEVLGNLG